MTEVAHKNEDLNTKVQQTVKDVQSVIRFSLDFLRGLDEKLLFSLPFCKILHG